MMEDQGVWEAIEPVEGEKMDMRKDKKARSHLLQALPEDLLMQVASKVTAKDVWEYLYAYQDVELPWLNARPTPAIKIKPVIHKKFSKGSAANAAGMPKNLKGMDQFPQRLNKTTRTWVPRASKSRSKKEKDEKEEVLVIEGIELDKNYFVKFDVYINDEDDPVSSSDKSEFAGSFVNVPHKNKHGNKMKVSMRLALTELLEDLHAEDDDGVVVTLVPRAGTEDVTVDGIKIELSD